MTARNLGQTYDGAVRKLVEAERRLRRSFHRWEKARDQVQRLERKLDRAYLADSTADDAPGGAS